MSSLCSFLANYHWAEPDPEKFKMLSPYTALRIQDSNVKRKSEIRHWEPEYPCRKTPKDHPISCNAVVWWGRGCYGMGDAHGWYIPMPPLWREVHVSSLPIMSWLAVGTGWPSIIRPQVYCGVVSVSMISLQHIPAVHVVSISESQGRAGVWQPSITYCMRLCIL